ncbi:DnaD domain-containing protein [Bacillus sp. 1P06AnD]|uniref:DnaD domain-containing protein n=1 Tax=Bacillus sp. 1P06AnD TaxID=3132208 RepID=UPI0039A2CBE8
MIKEQLLSWLQEGTVTIPSFLLVHYAEMGLDEQELLLLLQLDHFQKEGNRFPTPMEISDRMSFTAADCAGLLRNLIQKGFLELNEDQTQESVIGESYSLQPLYSKMIEHFLYKQNREIHLRQEKDEKSLYTIFEQEFGRPLSPFECETLGMWLDDDHHGSEIIMTALREAVVAGKLNFRYIDRILFEWKKNGIKTVDQAKAYGEKFRTYPKREQKPKPRTSTKEIQFYNWLEK